MDLDQLSLASSRFGADPGQIQLTSESSLQTTDPSAVIEARSGDDAKHGENANQGLKMADFMSTEWTDEKHSSHLNSIEESFVKQLYNKEYYLMGLSRWLSRRQKLQEPNTKQTNANSPCSFGQFKVLQGGCLQKLNFDRTRSRLDIRNESQDLLENPWIQHFRSGSTGRGPDVASKHSKQFPAYFIHMHLQDSIDGSAEASDQNFADDCDEGDSSSNLSRIKRMRTSAVDASNKDQVVPFERSPVPENTKENYAYVRKEDGGWVDGQLEKMNGFPCSREKQVKGGDYSEN